MKRFSGCLALGLAVLAAGGAAAWRYGLGRMEGEMRARGFAWEARAGDPWAPRWEGLSRPGVTIQRLSLEPEWPPRLIAEGVQVQGKDLSPSSGAGGEGPGIPDAASLPVPLAVEARGVDVLWGEDAVLTGLSGSLLPALDLTGDGGYVRRGELGYEGQIRRRVDLEHLSGEAEVTIRGRDPVEIELSMPEVVLSHPLLAPQPLPPAPVRAQATWAPSSGALAGSFSFGKVEASFSGTLTPSPLALALEVDAPAVPLAAVVDLFGPQIPEGRRARIRGTIALQADVSGPPLAWKATFGAKGLAAAGVVGLEHLRGGSFTYRAITGKDERKIRASGEGTAGWTPLAEARVAGDAAVASEDGGFWRHPGYDVEGIQAALDELAAGEPHPRGGSTITQQLAKNLFLDDDRTVARKLRELLYALEMERELGKSRILELYLNVVEYGPDIHGIQAASQGYFLKQPAGLTPKEAAFLAVILPAPRTWHHLVNRRGRIPENSVQRVLQRMVQTGALTEEAAQAAAASPLVVVPPG